MNIEEKKKRIDELSERLNEASRAYYADGIEIISNFEYDEMYDELLALGGRYHELYTMQMDKQRLEDKY